MAAAWNSVVKPLVEEFFARRPDLAFARGWPDAHELGLGACGSSAAVRWRRALTDALAGLARLDRKGTSQLVRGQSAMLSDWLEAELLLLEGQTLATSDPASYVRRALLTLRAAREALWMPPEVRAAKLASLLAELPATFREARVCLLAPSPDWIEAAVRDLEDLGSLVDELERELPKKPAKAPQARKREAPLPVEPTARDAVDGFRRWLLELLPSAGGAPPRLAGNEWPRLVQLVSGTAWKAADLKVQCLRELAQLDLEAREESARRPRALAPDKLELRIASASAQALRLAQEARLLPRRLKPKAVEFFLEDSLRERPEIASLRPGKSVLNVFFQRSHPSWSARRTSTRKRAFEGPEQQAVLGMRYGLAGEALLARAALEDRKAPPMLLDNRLVREGYGLFVLECMSAIDWIENPFRRDEELAREIGFQRGLEAARLLATLELHSEGHTLEEVLQTLRRRTGVDEDTAKVEVLSAQRDPLYGIAYLGLLELRTLAERIGGLAGPRKGTRITLLLLQRNPELRPSDLVAAVAAVGTKRAER